ncbi:TonB-dependent receptor [uncultured Chryseobacterium sp.]|uniref:TonB-dependent receptor domain-containing protein n=1 Tax=uncultured Chryseobacterium sp. TaxID=259322 RepID=UPI0025D6AAB3|nr:TonB-dependent receptor [uncultured Chryseobacterium sp.]
MKRTTQILHSKISIALLFFTASATVLAQQQKKADTTKTANIDEVIVTGVFDKRTRMNAPVAISVLKSELIERQVPNSAADLLKNVPGVYVNSSLGEIRNNVSSRGISAGSADGTFAYEYISMQEDGLPVTNTTYFNYGPDFFLRADATIAQIDAVRGGPASITAANAPGGIFNYISKTGGNKFSGEIRAKYGVQGADNSGFHRIDADFGGPLGDNWFYNIGGFYRYDLGARYPGYPFNNGGQVKANIMKKYNRGSVKVFLKYLDDHNGYAQLIPTKNYTDPEPAEGFSSSSSLLIPKLQYNSQDFIHGGNVDFNSGRLVGNQYRSVAINWDHDLGNDWKLFLTSKYADNSVAQNSIGNAFVTSLTDNVPYALLMGTVGVGTYSFRDALTGQELASVNAGVGATGIAYNVTKNLLPGQNVQNNSIILSPLNFYENKVKESMSQLTINKKWRNMNFSFGGYYGYSDVWRFSGINGIALTTLENRPRMLTLDFTGGLLYPTAANPFNLIPGAYKVTNKDGFAQGAGSTGDLLEFRAKQQQGAAFFGHTWDITENLTVDWGVRYEKVWIKGDNTRTFLTNTATQNGTVSLQGGPDHNPYTIYDNNTLVRLTNVSYSRQIDNFSYSAAVNYKFNNRFAVYGRYSQGSKAPDLDIFFASNREETIGLLNPQSRKTQQAEMGLKAKTTYFDAFVTPFYSVLKNIPVGAMADNGAGGFYTTPTLYNENETWGVEVETNIKPSSHFTIRAVLTLQDPKVKKGFYWNLNKPGIADDQVVSYSGTTVAYTPKIIANITPNLTVGNAFAFVTWSYLGEREGSNTNIYKLPAFSQFDLGVGYNFTKNLSAIINVNNVLNKYGVMSYQRPGSLVQQLAGFESFTQAEYDAAVANNTPYFTVAIPPTSGYLTVTYKF